MGVKEKWLNLDKNSHQCCVGASEQLVGLLTRHCHSKLLSFSSIAVICTELQQTAISVDEEPFGTLGVTTFPKTFKANFNCMEVNPPHTLYTTLKMWKQSFLFPTCIVRITLITSTGVGWALPVCTSAGLISNSRRHEKMSLRYT